MKSKRGTVIVKLASFAVNERAILEVTAEVPAWLPIRPRLDRQWLRQALARALRSHKNQ
jgi:hypothetical protein